MLLYIIFLVDMVYVQMVGDCDEVISCPPARSTGWTLQGARGRGWTYGEQGAIHDPLSITLAW